jgi:hypothetical protein
VTAPQAAPGQVVGAQYAVQGLLRHHGLSATYHALTAPHREVAIKVFDPELREFPEATHFLEQTIALTNALPANLALHVTDHGFDPEVGAPFTVTELSFQPSLAQLVQLCPLSSHEAAALLSQIALALGAAHGEGLAHLSLKPSNLFVGPTPTFETKLADFGASKVRRALSFEVPPVDVPWISPEQFDGEGGPSSDLFSAALVLFFALTGRSYWQSCQSKIDLKAWKSEIRAPRTAASARAAEFGITLGSDVDHVFERGLAVDPGARFRSLAEFASAFETAVGATAPVPRADSPLAVTEQAGAPAQDGTADASLDTQAEGVPARSSLARGAVMVAAGLAVAVIGVAALRSLRAPSRAESSAAMPSVPAATGPTPVPPSVDQPSTAESAPAMAAPEPASSNALAEAPSTEPVPTNGSAPDAAQPSLVQVAQKGNELAQLTVRCQPACEMIFVDNKKVESSVPVTIPAGTHLVAAGRTGFPARTERVTLAPGEKHVTTMTLVAQRPAPLKSTKPCGKFLKRCD